MDIYHAIVSLANDVLVYYLHILNSLKENLKQEMRSREIVITLTELKPCFCHTRLSLKRDISEYLLLITWIKDCLSYKVKESSKGLKYI